ncbi:MAG TPA: HAMP domain-containing sensor histidine kinase [Gemmatimonadaceae bacterium]|nr:HAMP domain-containing sensor histidine kinase [Gemmatimonadaceae bacterium]
MRAIGARPLLLGAALLGIVVVSALAVRESMRNAQQRKAVAERTVRDYAVFASYLYSTRGYLFALGRVNVSFAAFHLDQPYTLGELPPPSVIPAIPDTTERCGPASKWPIYRFRLDVPSRKVQYVGGRPDAFVDAIIRDSIPKLASTPWVMRAGFGYLFVEPPSGRETIAYARTRDSTGKLLAVYGYRSCYGVRDTSDYSLMYKVVRVLPPMLPRYSEGGTRSVLTGSRTAAVPSPTNSATAEEMRGRWASGMPADSLLILTIVDDQGRTLFQSPHNGRSSNLYGISPLGFVGGTTFYVNLRPDVARFLVAGGIPESHFPGALLLLAGSIILAIAGFASLRSEIRLVNSRQRFLANVSHELRTPLQQILMFVQLLRLGRTRNEEERERSLEIIERETNRLIALSNSVLAAAKPELQLQSAPVDVVHVAETAADFFTPLAEARKMRIVLDVPEPAIARGDPGAVRQILINVLDNAAKYGPIGQTITIGVRNDPHAVRLWVDDCGPGIPASERQNVWKPFVRLGGTLDDSTGGAGLGLSIVRDLATAMEATVDLTERPTGGTRFTLNLQRNWNGTPA